MRNRILLSIGLAVLTWLVLALVEAYLPFSDAKNRVIDAVSLPGAILAGFVYPEGIHTGRGAPGFLYVAVALNLIIYCLVWFGVLTLGSMLWAKVHLPRS
jgi:hypothetical protein